MDFLNDNCISLTKFVRNTINKIKESEDQSMQAQPSDESRSGDSIV